MKSRQQHYVFGPVPSRRLGRSLGVDVVPFKTYTFDCIYCQLGRATCHTVERKEWAPTNAVLDELKCKLACRPDYITLSGSDEPTLHSGLGDIIERIQAMINVPVAVLTNGSLLWQPQVCAELASAHVVLPSLDAGDATKFKFINRPHASLSFEQVIEGLIAFRRGFTGQCWLEVFLLAGQRLGLIQFGSRCDLYLPLTAQIQVKPGDRVVGGETMVATRVSAKHKPNEAGVSLQSLTHP